MGTFFLAIFDWKLWACLVGWPNHSPAKIGARLGLSWVYGATMGLFGWVRNVGLV